MTTYSQEELDREKAKAVAEMADITKIWQSSLDSVIKREDEIRAEMKAQVAERENRLIEIIQTAIKKAPVFSDVRDFLENSLAATRAEIEAEKRKVGNEKSNS